MNNDEKDDQKRTGRSEASATHPFLLPCLSFSPFSSLPPCLPSLPPVPPLAAEDLLPSLSPFYGSPVPSDPNRPLLLFHPTPPVQGLRQHSPAGSSTVRSVHVQSLGHCLEKKDEKGEEKEEQDLPSHSSVFSSSSPLPPASLCLLLLRLLLLLLSHSSLPAPPGASLPSACYNP